MQGTTECFFCSELFEEMLRTGRLSSDQEEKVVVFFAGVFIFETKPKAVSFSPLSIFYP
jgi:tRNA G37 N-methylase Trm5